MDRTRTRTVRLFAERLQTTVDESVIAAKAVQHELKNSRRSTVMEKEKVVQQIQKDVDEVNVMMTSLLTISEMAPAASQLMELGFARVNMIDEILDAFERRLQSEFGISPVSVSSIGSESPPTPSYEARSSGAVRGHSDFGVPITPRAHRATHETFSTSGSRIFSPQAMTRQEPAALLSVSKTPRMEDFGIDVDKVLELREQSNSFLHESTSRIGTRMIGTGRDERFIDDNTRTADYTCDWKEESFPQDVRRSMRELGIETQQEVTERFHTRRNLALQNVLQGCTPQLKSGTVPRMDFTRLAAGYTDNSVTGSDERAGRELNFEEDE